MPRFDIYRNPNPAATHPLFLDVQSNLVRTATRWCVPLFLPPADFPALTRAQCHIAIGGEAWLLDAPNILAVPMGLLKVPVHHLLAEEQALVENALEFMLRGY